MLEAVTPLLHIDIWQKLAKNTKNGPLEVIGNVIFVVEVEPKPDQSIPILLTQQCSTIVCSTRVALRPSRSKDIVTFMYKKCNFGYLTGQKGGISPHTGKPEKSRLLRFLIISEYVAPQKV